MAVMGGQMRQIITITLMIAMAAGLSACGRKGRPIAPEGATVRHYPDIDFPQGRAKTTPPAQQDQNSEEIPSQ